MLVTLLSTNTPQQLASALTGQAPLQSGRGVGEMIGAIFGFIISISAAFINYRRNHSIFYAFLAFFFSEFYLAFVLVSYVFKKVDM
jgi:hypothetical protein